MGSESPAHSVATDLPETPEVSPVRTPFQAAADSGSSAPAAPRARDLSNDRGIVAEQILSGFAGPVKRRRPSLGYRLAAAAVATLMVLLPIAYLALIGLIAFGVYYHAANHTGLLHPDGINRPRIIAVLAFFAPIVAGGIAIVFMFKPLFARAGQANRSRSLRRDAEPLLFEFVDKICETVGAPRPKRIDLDCQVNASASFRRGLLSMFGQDLVLTVGMPLLAGLNTRQLADVLAHEFGHFSQGVGMRLSYLIQSLNHWFLRVVYQRDEADEWLSNTAGRLDFRLACILWLAMGFVAISRGMLWALMNVGHFFGRRLLRQMEFDADRFGIRVAGSDVFEQTARQMHLLAMASQWAFADLRELYRERRLVDDLPRLIMARSRTLPPKALASIEKDIAQGRTKWFDTHPCDADRIAAARREGAAGVFTVELPASMLLADFDSQCKAATWDYYLGIFGSQLSRDQLRPVSDIEAKHERDRKEATALDRYFQGVWHAAAPLPLSGVLLAVPEDPRQALAELKEARRRMDELVAGASGLVAQLESVQQPACELASMAALVRSKAKFKREVLAKWGGRESIPRAAQAAHGDVQRVIEQFAPLNAAAARRLALALQLALVPSVAKRLTQRGDATEIRKVLETLQLLCDPMKTLASIYPSFTALCALVRRWQAAGDHDDISPVAVSEMRKLQPTVKSLRATLSRGVYPFSDASSSISLAQYLMPEVPLTDDLGSLLTALNQVFELAPNLYARLLGRLVDVTLAVEEICGVTQAPADDSPEAA